jgi:F0F1-type ATP synthase membrane subunit b/b'
LSGGFDVGLEAEVRSFVQEIDETLKRAETDLGRLAADFEKEIDAKQPQAKRMLADAVRRAITELEKIEARLKQ